MTIHKWLDFNRDQDQDTDPGISQRILLNCTQGELSGLGGGLQSPTVSVFCCFRCVTFCMPPFTCLNRSDVNKNKTKTKTTGSK